MGCEHDLEGKVGGRGRGVSMGYRKLVQHPIIGITGKRTWIVFYISMI